MNESRLWSLWADWLGIAHHTLFAALGAVIERNEPHRRVFELVRPGFDLDDARRARAREGTPEDVLNAGDIYADALPCLAELRARGYKIGIAGNQPARTAEILGALRLPADVVATSEGWGVAKPSPEFFARIIDASGVPPSQIAYVGDRLDNDVLPARAAGMFAVFLQRGPWGVIHRTRPEASLAHLKIDNLAELADRLEALKLK